MTDYPGLLTGKQYNIIYADPPWSYKDKANAGKRGASWKYPTQTDKWLYNMPVNQLTYDNCYLFLWVTMPKLPIGLKLIDKWDFNYKTVAFTWVKTNKRQTDTLFWGMGNHTRANAELCLLATKGRLERQSASVHSVVMSPILAHSEKPSEVRERIVTLLGDLPRIELFARQYTEGWDVWGNEV